MKKKTLVIAAFTALTLATIIGMSNNLFFSPVSTNAQQNTPRSFEEINEDIKQNNLQPTYIGTEKILNDLFTNLSALELPNNVQASLASDVALAHLNGTSVINNINIVSASNSLATSSSAPSYAHTNDEQVKVVRTYLNRLLPDGVKTEGEMNDLEAFAVFVAVVSQKVSNEVFMVTPAEFTASMNQASTQPFPGSSEAEIVDVEVVPDTVKMDEMFTVITDFAGSKQMVSSNDIVSSIGIN